MTFQEAHEALAVFNATMPDALAGICYQDNLALSRIDGETVQQLFSRHLNTPRDCQREHPFDGGPVFPFGACICRECRRARYEATAQPAPVPA